MTQAVQSMTNRTLSGLFWMSMATAANVISLLLVLIVLARLLTPADFGLVAAALMVIGFSAIFSDFGIGHAVVQRPNLQTTHVRSGFTLIFFFSMLLWGLTWFLAPVVAGLFRLEELTPILRALSVTFPVQGLAIVAESLLMREFRFRCVALLDTFAVVVGYGGAGIALATLGFGAWALVVAHLAQTFLRTVLLLVFRPHPAWPLLERRACADLLGFGGGFTAGRLSNYLAGQGEHFVIGWYLGPVALGVYGRAYQLMAGPAVLFGGVLDRVLFPVMVHVQDQPQRLADAYRRGIALIALVILPVSVFLVALAPEVVHVVLGSDWDAVIVPLQILGVGVLFRTSCKISDTLVRATGAVYRRTWRQTVYAALVVLGAWIGQHWGVEGVAVAVLATLAVNFFLMAHLGLCLAGMSWRTFAGAHLSGLALAAVVGLPVAVTVEALRAWSFSPLLIVALSMAAIAPSLFAIAYLPRVFLGHDGKWMVGKLMALLFPAAQPQSLEGHGRTSDSSQASPLPDTWAHTANGTARTSSRQGQLLVSLSRRLAARGVRYCRWKSPLDLPRVLSGKGDLDLLVEPSDIEAFLRVAEGLGFKRVMSCFEPHLAEDLHLYGLDQATGALLHLHVSLSLLSDENVAGNMVPSLEELVLGHCTTSEGPDLLAGMPVVRPQAELIVVILQSMERYARLRNFPRLAGHKKSLQAKLQALRDADPEEGWKALLERWLPSASLPLFSECLAALRQPTSWLRRYYLAGKFQGALRIAARTDAEQGDFRCRELAGETARPPDKGKPSTATLLALRMRNLFQASWWRLGRGRWNNPKQLPTVGIMVAFIGPDASGKSTMVAESSKWLGQVFKVEVAHLGKPPSAWLTLLPNLVGRLLRLMAPKLRTYHQQPASAGGSSGGQGLLYRFRAVLLAWDRRALAVRLARKAARGWIVLCDRYPSATVGAPDSARLKYPDEETGQSWLRSYLARLENRLYRAVPRPTLVIRLSAPLGVAIERNRERQKPGKEGDDFVTSRHNGFFVPSFRNAHLIELDTTTSREETVHMLRQRLWERLGRSALHSSPRHEQATGLHALNGFEHETVLLHKAKNTLVVEFIGVSGGGKSTLVAAVMQFLTEQGFRVHGAEDAILARYGLQFSRHPKVRSVLIHLLSVVPFGRYLFTRQGCRLSCLALRSIVRGMGGMWVGVSLVRNFMKRIGSHFLLEQLRDDMRDCDVVIWDEGVVHAAHNLFVHTGTEPEREKVEEFARMVPKPDLIVWVTTPSARSAEVLLARGHPRVNGKSGAAQAFSEHAQVTFEVLSCVEGLQERIYRMDNSARAAAQQGAAIRARAREIGEFLVRQIHRDQEPLTLAGAPTTIATQHLETA